MHNKQNKPSAQTIRYPRKVLIRKTMTSLGKALLTLFADVEIHGREKLPKKGPVLLAGNHAAILEVVMLAAYTPGNVEFLGTGDIPFDRNYAFIVKAYDLIPVNRGNLDRQALNTAVSVLEQGGILGIFPEGGIWDAGQMQAQLGASWLSYRAQAPIIPIGFGGILDGLQKAIKLKRPKLVMNVGDPIAPVTLEPGQASLKAILERSSTQLLDQIRSLVPQSDAQLRHTKLNEVFSLEVQIHSARSGTPVPLPEDMQIKHGSAYARLMFYPVILDILVRNLQLPIHAIKDVQDRNALGPLIAAWSAILAYLEVNPGFFTYRFGVEEGLAVQKALNELRHLALWVQERDLSISVIPYHRYLDQQTGEEVLEKGGRFPHSMRDR